jgi:hypothetical protein
VNNCLRIGLLALIVGLTLVPAPPDEGVVRAEFVTILTIVLLVAGIGMSVAGIILARKRVKGLAQKDEAPDTTVTRGGYIPLIIGRARIGPVIMYSSEPKNIGGPSPESGPSGKRQQSGGSSPPPDFFVYEVVHCICVGPVNELHGMWANGKPLDTARSGIDPNLTPSGSGVGFAQPEQDYGIMDVYWGARDEPIDLNNLTIPPGLGGAVQQTVEIVSIQFEPFANQNTTITVSEVPVGIPVGTIITVIIRGTSVEPNINGEQKVFLVSPASAKKFTLGNIGIPVISSQAGTLSLQPQATQLDMGLTQVFSTVWDNLQTGNQKQHPLIEYGVTVVPRSQLKRSASWIFPEWREERNPNSLAALQKINSVLSVSSSAISINIDTFVNPELWKIGEVVHLTGGLARTYWGVDQVYTVVIGGNWTTQATTNIVLSRKNVGRVVTGTLVFIDTGRDFNINVLDARARGVSVTQFGTVSKLESDGRDGANGAHVLDQLFFAPKPWGAGLNREYWDIDSLEDLGVEFESLKLAVSIGVYSGDNARGAIGKLMQDLGVVTTFNPDTGLWGFEKVIDTLTGPGRVYPTVQQSMLTRPLPETSVVHGPRRADRLQFVFNDEERNFRENTFTLGDDGQAQAEGVDRVKVVEITSTVHHETARKLGVRRQNEEFSRHSGVTLTVGRACRLLRQGIKIAVQSIPWTILVSAIKRDPFTDEVQIQGIRDPNDDPSIQTANAEASGNSFFENVDRAGVASDGAGDAGSPAISADPTVMVMEVSRFAVDDNIMRAFVFRIRATANEVASDLYFSADDTEFVKVQTNAPSVPGGTLVSNLEANTKRHITDQSVVITPVGPDINLTIAVTTDATHRRGRLLMVIDGKEVCHVKGVIALGNGNYYVNDVIRGRWGTDVIQHVAGKSVIFVTDRQLTPIADATLYPGSTLYVKSTPRTSRYQLDQSDVASNSLAMVGDAFGPLDPANLRNQDGTDSYAVGGDLDLKWSYRALDYSPRNGAGMQGAGDPCGSTAGLQTEGEFILRFYDDDPAGPGVLKNYEDNLSQRTFTYTNANMIADFGAEPSEMWVTLECVRGGLRSTLLTRHFERR